MTRGALLLGQGHRGSAGINAALLSPLNGFLACLFIIFVPNHVTIFYMKRALSQNRLPCQSTSLLEVATTRSVSLR